MNKHLAKATFWGILLNVSGPSDKCNFKHFIALQLVLGQTYTKEDLNGAAAIFIDVEGKAMQLSYLTYENVCEGPYSEKCSLFI